jgi:citrate lyase subunit gamma (acyl carrier protein)
MKIIKKAQAGSFESSDILFLVEPVSEGMGRNIEIKSEVYKQYGNELGKIISSILDNNNISDIHLIANDKGAIVPVIKARLETVLLRASGEIRGTLYK